MTYLNRLILVLVSLLFLIDIVHAETAGDLNTQGRASFVSRDGNNLYLGTEGDDDVIIVQNNVTTFSIDGTTGAITFSGTLTPELPNNTYLTAKNTAGSADIDVLKVDATDDTVLNADTGDIIKLSVAGTSIATVEAGGLLPATDGNNTTSNLGSTTFGFKNIYLSDATRRAQIFVSNGLYVSYPSGQGMFFREASTDRWTIPAGATSFLGAAATGTTYHIGSASVDATDSNVLTLGAASTGAPSRSGHLFSYGNEASGGAGVIGLAGGAVSTGFINLDIGHASAGARVRNTSGNALWTFDNSGVLASSATYGSDIVMNVSGTGMRMGTSDAADNKILMLSGGGAVNSSARGAYFLLNGNEAAGTGRAILGAGNVAGALVRLVTSGAHPIEFYTNGALSWTMNSSNGLVSASTTSIGWTPVSAANQACNTTCTSGCVFGIDTGSTTNSMLACTDAAADVCLCAGAS